LAARACLAVPAAPLDKTITERLVGAITPLTIELALTALTSLEERDRETSAQWRMRIERARYEVDLAERRYEAVDPANRLIAATLETRWNDAMQRLHDLEAELADFERKIMRTVTSEQKQQILALANDFPRLWAADTTTPRDRKRILRLLVRDITVVKGPEPKIVRLHVRWQGGQTETLQLILPPNRADVVRYPDAFVERIRELARDHHDDEIVALLSDDGHRSATGKKLTVATIKWLRYKYSISAPRPPEGSFTVRQMQERYRVSLWVVHYWIKRGIISAAHRRPGTPYAITIDDELDNRLRSWVANSAHLFPESPMRTA
jgi:DNA-binding transcriptional MerR regulator